jgi:hypothetical protein
MGAEEYQVDNRLPSESYRVAAKDWVAKDGAARLLEDSKSAVMAQRMAALGDMAVNKAEQTVKASEEWDAYIKVMVEARTAANLAKVKTEWCRMRFMEWQSENANQRAEMRL